MNENVEKFKEFAEKDPELMEKLKAAKSLDEIIAIASENGFTIDASDVVPDANDELNLDDLEAVSGGQSGDCYDLGQHACVQLFSIAEW